MTITTEHAASRYGIPVILDDVGRLLDYPDGIRLAIERLGWNNKIFADQCGASIRTVEGWRTGRPVDAGALNVLRDALKTLENPGKKKIRKKA